MSLKRHAWPYARRDFHGINLAVVVLDEEQLARFDPRRAYVFKKWRIICDLARVSRSHEHHDRVLEASRDGVARALGSVEEVNGRAGAQQVQHARVHVVQHFAGRAIVAIVVREFQEKIVEQQRKRHGAVVRAIDAAPPSVARIRRRSRDDRPASLNGTPGQRHLA